VAQETGFSDHSHLIRTFRRFTGTTPTRFACGSHPVGFAHLGLATGQSRRTVR
jgi:AraC-like DNA-binding protein